MVWQPVEGKENSEFKPANVCLRIIPVSHPARAVGMGIYIHFHLMVEYKKLETMDFVLTI